MAKENFETTWVKAIVDPKLYPFLPGSTIRMWGFDFTIYTDKSLCLKMHNDFVSGEVKAGRVKIMESPPPGIVEIKPEKTEHKKISIDISDQQFTYDITNYFGSGNMNRLIEDLRELTNPKIRTFAKKRFENISFASNATKDDMLDKIRSLTDIEILRLSSSNKESDEDQ